MSFLDNWKRVADLEGGFVDDASDSGGATRFGVTEKVAREHGYTGPMRDLPFETATAIAKLKYWDPMRLDDIDRLMPKVAAEMFDTGYNAGIGRASRFLQRALNGLNRLGKDYDDLVVDGKIGRRTVQAMTAYKEVRGHKAEGVLFKALDCLQGAFYIELVERREKDEKFLFGWLDHRVGSH